MRIIQSSTSRPLDRLTIGPGGLIVAAYSQFTAAGGAEAWDASTGAPVWRIAFELDAFRYCSFLLGGAYLFVSNFECDRLFALPPGREPVEVSQTKGGNENAAADDRVIVARGGVAPALSCWGVPDMNVRWVRDREDRWNSDTYFGSVALAPTGNRFALSVYEGLAYPKQSVQVRDAAGGELRVSVPMDSASPVRQLAFTADGVKLLVRTDSRKVQMCDAITGAPVGELVHPGRSFVTGIAVHPGGTVACTRNDGTVTLWDTEKGKRARTYDWKVGKLVSVAFSPDGALAAAGTEDGKVIVWDVDL
ncbi:WD domain, G-beta repeat [Gemmata obscuriglobus]|uniref:Uncharacterized protein n=1 Tax=Gemmata obscuriglobus TaxID=114 RepID=A0A2Z3H830_9BACT|nr:WD40 repeat domain-containing protein [Gemmata obscuriglobus]AWM41858.1 hypothetical protein C1280_35945 [Gemmata obscuriglobus]QEG32174.1 WD domain, G-beta repeat [Gemmata obscuriglobus]VTS11527.1 wd-40 repeat protein : WD40 repeat-like protein OS=Aspergillus ruber CBS 135680 GN=EURHEDRAFT_414651 PE=4 SV=1: PQQ_2: WD40 [Gemmata obscuriglobus UQM 2246]